MWCGGSSLSVVGTPWWLGPAGIAFFPAGANWLLVGAAALTSTVCAAIVVRLMDEHLDRYQDEVAQRYTIGRYLGSAALPYALFVFSLAALIAPSLAATLVLAAYAVGMTGDVSRPLPSGLPGYAEVIAAIAVATWGVGWQGALWAVCCMSVIQCGDDFLDRTLDARTGQRNLCRRWGKWEVVMTGLLLLLVAMQLSVLLTGVVAGAVVILAGGWSILSDATRRWGANRCDNCN